MGKLDRLLDQKTIITLVFLVILAICIRFLYFPENIYFGYDQARDAFLTQEVLHGELKIVGPTTSIPGLNHGALFYYLFAPIYFLSQGDPTGLSIFLRIYNSFGLILIFLIARNLFDKKDSSRGKWVGLIAAGIYAISYEQTQYALFMTHPTLAVLSVLTFYLGLSYLIFKQKVWGLPIAVLGLGLSFQFHFLLAYLVLIFILNIVIFWKKIPKPNIKTLGISGGILFVCLSTFILAEIKFKFAAISNLINSPEGFSKAGMKIGGIDSVYQASVKYVTDNVFYLPSAAPFLLIAFLLISIYFLRQKESRDKIIFLLVWFVVGLSSYFATATDLYFYGVGTSLSLVLLLAFTIYIIYSKYKYLAVLIILVVLGSNIYLISTNNKIGPNKAINVQTGMLLGDQKRAIDYIYQNAGDQPFAVNAFSMPLFINTTWAYLFEYYGKREYGREPLWGGKAADGYPGNLIINNSRTTLPEKRFLILEPARGFESKAEDFLREEGYFTDIIEEKKFGEITVYMQKPK